MALTIPRTQLRLQPYITIRSAIYTGVESLPSFGSVGSMQEVFAVQKVTMTNSRPVNIWRELRTDNYRGASASPIKESYPGLATYELELDRVVLYNNNSGKKGTIVEALGFSADNNGADLMYQSQPLVLAFQLFEPSATVGGADEVQTYMFYGCWLQDNPFTFDVTQDDLKIVQTVKVTAAGVKQS